MGRHWFRMGYNLHRYPPRRQGGTLGGMSKRTSFYECTSCGHQEAKWLGQCPSCGEWNTLVERRARAAGERRGRTGSGSRGSDASRRSGGGRDSAASGEKSAGTGGDPTDGLLSRRLGDISPEHSSRISSGLGELDRALGGGLMPGSTVLIGGEPGIGKSTLMLQMAGSITGGSVLYVSGEESVSQIRQRADRLKLPVDGSAGGLSLLCSSDIDDLLDELDHLEPRIVVVDSVQTMIAADAGSVPGTVNQIKFVTHELTEWARRTRGCILMVAHVTKEGQIAGPKVVEHMVDAVLLFEHSGSDLRFLRATKNRFGAIEEVGIFTMEQRGLVELTDPGRIFLGGERGVRPAGVVAAPCYEGSRVLVVEIQALTVPAKGSVSRSFSDRIDNRRVSRVAAVLEKHVGVRFSDQDVYVNVAGGMRIQDVAIDLPLALALYSARTGLTLPAGTLATGELSLAGEIRPISHHSQRDRAAREMGFTRLVGPESSTRGSTRTGNDRGGSGGDTGEGTSHHASRGSAGIWQNVTSLPGAVKTVFGESLGRSRE
jgi:DNA repair protein RadA/Sms